MPSNYTGNADQFQRATHIWVTPACGAFPVDEGKFAGVNCLRPDMSATSDRQFKT